MRFLQRFDTEGFMPHGMCYLWEPELLWTHVVSDILIGMSYVAISLALAWLVWRSARERVDRAGPFERLPFWWMFLAFGLFIVACGVTHFMGAWTVWNPDYWASGGAKVVTALASVATAVAFPPLIPRALKLVRDARASEVRKRELEEAHRELKAVNERVRELDALKTEFFANVSHELRTPLTLITAPVERRLSRSDLEADERRELESVLRNARILHKHVDDLLDVTRLDAGGVRPQLQRGDLARLVRRLAGNFDGLAEARDVRFVVDADETIPAEVDPDQLERVVLNLLSNAFKFTPEGGVVRVTLRPGADTPFVRLEVADSGPGVPPDLREAVFERFRQVEGGPDRPFGGTGLGLTIVRELVELHDGEIRVEEAPEGGALFTVLLPVLPSESGEAPADAADVEAFPPRDDDTVTVPPVEPPGGEDGAAAPTPVPTRPAADEAVVLVVEDNADLGRFLLEILPEEIHGVLAADGEEGLRLATELRPDVIVSDVMMPGMTGDDLLRAVRSREDLAGIPFIVLTARADDEERIEMLERGAQDYVTKPFTAAEVEARVRIWLAVARVRRLLQDELEVREEDLESLATELTRRKRELENALEATEVAREEEALASEAKSEFLAVMSHELRTPLTAIVGYADLLLAELSGPINENQRKQLERVVKSSEHLLELIEQILDYSRLDRGDIEARMERVDPAALVLDLEPVVRPLADEKGLDFRIEGVEKVAHITTDPGRMRQVLVNLLTNAVKYTDEGRVRLVVEDGDRDLRIRVEDTGIGIAPDDRQRIFDPFWQVDQSSTRETGGAGLGLSIARKLARRLGGDLTVQEREGGGSVFTFILPRTSARSTVSEGETTPGTPRRRTE